MRIAGSVMLLAAALAPMAAVAEDFVPQESTERFLAGVRDFAGGKLTPGPLYDPKSAGLPIGVGAPPVHVVATAIVPAPASWRRSSGRLAGTPSARNTAAATRSLAPALAFVNSAPRRSR